jgi:hypothetical protein
MKVEAYLRKSWLFPRLRSGPHGQLVERHAARLIEERLVRLGTWHCLNVVGGLLSWIASRRYALTTSMSMSSSVISGIEAYGSPSSPVNGQRSSGGCRYYARKERSRRQHRNSQLTTGSSRNSKSIYGRSADWRHPPPADDPPVPARGMPRRLR